MATNWPLRPTPMEFAWHYTPRRNLKSIIESGTLLPTKLEWDASKPRPAIYFTTNRSGASVPRFLRHQESTEWIRFGYEGYDLFPIAKFPQIFSSDLTQASVEEKLLRDPATRILTKDWRAVFRSIAVDEFSIIEATDDNGETWRTVWTNPNRGGGPSSIKH